MRSTKRISSRSRNGTRSSRLGGHRHLVVADQDAVGQEHARVEVERLLEQIAAGDVRRARRARERARSSSASLAGAPPTSAARTSRVGDLDQPQQPLGVARGRRAGGRRGGRGRRARAARGPARRRAGAARRHEPRAVAAAPRPGGARSRRAARRRPGRRARPSRRRRRSGTAGASAGADGMPHGSSRRGTQRASSARKSVSSMAVSWWSVPIRRALSAASARSSSTSPWPGKPIVKVLGGVPRALRHGRHDGRASRRRPRGTRRTGRRTSSGARRRRRSARRARSASSSSPPGDGLAGRLAPARRRAARRPPRRSASRRPGAC